MEQVIVKLTKLAKEETIYDEDDDVCIDGYACGNVDDAFSMGEHTGEVFLAREILSLLCIDWWKE